MLEAKRTTRAAKSHRVYGEVYEDLRLHGHRAARMKVFSTYASRLWGISAEAGTGSATCIWDGHYGLNSPAVTSVRAMRGATLTVNTENLADTTRPSFSPNCAAELGRVLTDAGISSSDQEFLRSTVAGKYPVPPAIPFVHFPGGFGGGVHHFAASGASPTQDKAGKAGVIMFGATAVATAFTILSGGSVDGVAIIGGSLGAGLAMGIGVYETMMLDDVHTTEKDLPEGGIDGPVNVPGWDDSTDLNQGDGGAGSGSDSPPPSGNDSGSSNDDPSSNDSPWASNDTPTTTDPGSDPGNSTEPPTGDPGGNDPGGSCQMALWCENFRALQTQ